MLAAMKARDWSVWLVEPSKFEARIVTELLRFSGVEKIRVIADGEEALSQLRESPPDFVIVTLDDRALDALDWTRRLRRDRTNPCRHLPVFLLTKTLNVSVAQRCRIAGANAVIGKPTSSAALSRTIRKVLAHPRPFIDSPVYVGPCRRAGIVTTQSPYRRRCSDASRGQAA
jgi:CheY-like chemotaxis protein